MVMMLQDIKTYNFNSGRKLGLEIIPMEKLYKRRDLLTRPHRAAFYHILWFFKGIRSHDVDFQKVEVQDNSLLFLDKDIVHCYEDAAEPQGLCILFTEEFFFQDAHDKRWLMRSALFSNLVQKEVLILKNDDSFYRDIVNLIDTESRKSYCVSQEGIVLNLLKALLLHAERAMNALAKRASQNDAHWETVYEFSELLEEHFRSNKQVNAYAAMLNISRKSLIKACGGILGSSPKQIIDNRIMLEAKRLLTHSNHSIKETSYILGFDEPTNFVKFFRKFQGVTPREFRIAHQWSGED